MSEQHQEQSGGQSGGGAGGVNATIDQWFRDHVHGSIVARDVDTYNHVHNAVEDLKKRLAGIGVR